MAVAPTTPAAPPVLSFCPAPRRLPEVKFFPVNVHAANIGGRATTVYACQSTASIFAVVRDGVLTQAGGIKIAARVLLQADGSLAFRLPYEIVAIKRETKEAVQRQQTKLQCGFDGDNSMLSTALLTYLQSLPAAAPHVPRFLEAWHDDGHLYTVLEYLEQELRAAIETSPGGALGEEDTRVIVGDAMRALRVMHACGWCHRDISPENIMLSKARVPHRGVLIDFGTAASMTPTASPIGVTSRSSSGPETPTASSARLHVSASTASLSSAAPAHDMLAVPLEGSLGGFAVLPPPPPKGAFCKRSYADPCYIYHKPYGGVAFDLWSIAQVLYACVNGSELYKEPVPGADRGFSILWENEARHSGEDDSDDAGNMPLARFLVQRNVARASEGRPPFSPAFCDLLTRLFRIRPAFRPLNVDSVLLHPWFSGIPPGRLSMPPAAASPAAAAMPRPAAPASMLSPGSTASAGVASRRAGHLTMGEEDDHMDDEIFRVSAAPAAAATAAATAAASAASMDES